MNVKEYIRDHRGTIRKAVIIGVPTAAGIAIGCRVGFIPYKQIAGAAVRAGRKVPLNRIPVRAIGVKAKEGVMMIAGSEAAAAAGTMLKRELKREIRGEAGKYVRKKIEENRQKKQYNTDESEEKPEDDAA